MPFLSAQMEAMVAIAEENNSCQCDVTKDSTVVLENDRSTDSGERFDFAGQIVFKGRQWVSCFDGERENVRAQFEILILSALLFQTGKS